jgi:hypothetical protein
MVVNVVLIPLGLVALIAGGTGAMAVDEIWWAFALLAVAGAVILFAGVRGVIGWGKAVNVEDHTMRAMLAAAPSAADAFGRRSGPVLAHWRYAPEEWHAYAAAELRYRTREALAMGGIVVALGTAFLGLVERKWGLAFGISAAVGGLIALGRWAVAWSAHRRNVSVASGEVIVGPTALLVNGRYEVLHDRRIHFGGARVLPGPRPAILELTVMVPGRYRRIPEEYRIPIPAGREAEAHAVIEALHQAHGSAPALAQPAGG